MDLHLRGLRALITGGSRGIGLAAAETLAEEGCDVTLVARDAAALEAAADRIRSRWGVRAETIPADLSTEAAVRDVAARAGTPDILVNNAGAIPPGNLLAVDDNTWLAAWALKVHGFIRLTRALYPGMAARRSGVVVNVIGAAGERLPPDYVTGATGNAALMAFTRALGRAAPRDGLRVVGINPGPVATERHERLGRARASAALGDPDRWPELAVTMPFGRAATPGEIGAAVAFLASPRSGYTSGTVLTVDGGGG